VSTSPTPARSDVVEERGLRGLPPFVDVVYGAVFGYGVLEIARSVQNWAPGHRGNAVPTFLLIVTSAYLLFDYAQARMFTEKNPYKGLTRFTLDMAVAVTFTFAYIAAINASPKYLLALAVILALGAWWVSACKTEYPLSLQHSRFIITCHIAAAVALVAIWGLGFLPYAWLTSQWRRWVNPIVCVLYLIYCFVLTLITAKSRLSDIERSLLPIIPLYAPWRRIKVRVRRLFKL
jgi:hypothetical protein